MGEGSQPDDRSEAERAYDEEIAPQLLRIAERCRDLGMGIIAQVEYEPGATAVTTLGITKQSHITMQMLRVLSFSGGNLDAFLAQCMERFDMSQTKIGHAMRGLEEEKRQDGMPLSSDPSIKASSVAPKPVAKGNAHPQAPTEQAMLEVAQSIQSLAEAQTKFFGSQQSSSPPAITRLRSAPASTLREEPARDERPPRFPGSTSW